ncbi:MAG TPA: phosphoribosyltransferase family protein [Bryobacteraceae bacterium]|nr:phosphoribosyltransferase family protein [Bryobacteraceae bacterium]
MLISLPFNDRVVAGKLLAEKLKAYVNRGNLRVLGLPRGGLPVAYEIARHLNAPLDALLVRKLGVPGQRELAFGAIAAGGVRVLDDDVIGAAGLSAEEIERIISEESRELETSNQRYREGRPALNLRGCAAMVVDDGAATGSTMKAAIEALRLQGACRVVAAAPVASAPAAEMLREQADDFVCLAEPEPFYAVGFWYRDFSQVSDEEVRRLLAGRAEEPAA